MQSIFKKIGLKLKAISILLFILNGTLLSQELALKSKYSYSTPALEAAQKLYSQRKYPEALTAFEEIIGQANQVNNYEEVVYAMEKKALTLRRLGRYDDVIITMDNAIKVARQNLPQGHFLIAKMYYTRGSTDHILRNFYNARSYMDTALIYYDNATTYDSTAHYRILEYKYYGYQYSEGSSDTLIKYLDKLIEFEQLNKSTNRHDKILNLLQGYPEIYLQKGDFEQALSYAIQGFRYAKDFRDAVSDRYFAEAQYELSQVLYLKGNYAKALEIGNGLIQLVESIPRNRMPEYYAFNNLLGLINMELGDFSKALFHLDRAVSIPTDVGNSFQRQDKALFKAKVMINLGLCYINLGQSTKGKSFLDESLVQMKSLIETPSPTFHDNYELLGDFYQSNSDWKNALISYDSALRNSLEAYNEALLEFPINGLSDGSTSFPYTVLRTLAKKAGGLQGNAASMSDSREQLKASIDYVRKTHDLLMRNRETFTVSEGKLFLSENFKSLYETGLNSSYELYKNNKDLRHFQSALDFAKLSKAILFLEQSQEFELVNNDQVPQEMKEKFFESKTKIDRLQSLFYELVDSSITSDSVVLINDSLFEARKHHLYVKDTLNLILNDFRTTPSSHLGLTESSNELKVPKGKALIEFFVGRESIYVLGKSNSRVSFEKVVLDERLKASIKQVINIVSEPPNLELIDEQFTSFKVHSKRLYETLIKKTLSELGPEINHLIFIPDETLSRVPMGALVIGEKSNSSNFADLDYLIKSYKIQYQLSSGLLEKAPKSKSATNEFLAVGFRQFGESSGSQQYGSLSGTEREIRFLESNIEGEFLIGKSGQKSDFLNKARNYDILHLAVHGKADTARGYESSLIFNGPEDYALNTNDLYLAGLNARLAVLSACESGTGAISKGEGTFSIARGFSIVGVPSVVMSLWTVNDKITSDLMVDMHAGFINDGKSINDALRSAKLNYLYGADAYGAHPYYWAAFSQLGENITFRDKAAFGFSSLKLWLLIALALLSTILTTVYIKRKRAL